MTVYTWERIRDNWLAGGVVAVDPAAAVEAFNRVAEYFSEDWVEASRVDQHGTIGRGTASTLHVITLGQLLQQLDGVDNTERLLTKLQRRDPSALAELDAIHLVCSGRQGVGLELEPAVQVGSRNRHPDFRVRQSADEWTYVEVTQANVSVTQADVRSQLQRLTSLVSQCEGSFGLEVFLKREATTPEVDETAAEILRAHGQAGQRVVELPAGLGTLYWNTSSPGSIELDDHGESYTPRLGMASAVVGDDHQRHIAVRWPFTDERAEEFITSEARQLPTDAPGLIMIQTSGAVGATTAWRALIERRLQPTIHTRVSGVCLFSSGIRGTGQGEAWQPVHGRHQREGAANGT